MCSTESPPFRRRHYHSIVQLWHDLRQLAALRAQPHAAVSPALRERLMLMVTSVNQCRYCAAFHTRAAQLSGITPSEIALLLGGEFQHAPEFELPALVYAQLGRGRWRARPQSRCATGGTLWIRAGSWDRADAARDSDRQPAR